MKMNRTENRWANARRKVAAFAAIAIALSGANAARAQESWTFVDGGKTQIVNSIGWAFNVLRDDVNMSLSVTNCVASPGYESTLDFSGPVDGGNYAIVNYENGGAVGYASPLGGLLTPDHRNWATNIVIASTATNVGTKSFYCGDPSYNPVNFDWGITSLTLGDSLKSIGPLAFGNCTNITGSLIPLPASLESVGMQAFLRHHHSGKLVFPPTMKAIGEQAFCNSAFSEVVIPESVTNVAAGAFARGIAIDPSVAPADVLKAVYFRGLPEKVADIYYGDMNFALHTAVTTYVTPACAPFWPDMTQQDRDDLVAGVGDPQWVGHPIRIFDNWADLPYRDMDWPRAGIEMDGTDIATSASFSIHSAEQLAQFAWHVNNGETFAGATIYLEDDIDLSEHWWTPAAGVNPNFPFQGMFEGQSHTIRGLRLSPDHVAAPQTFMGLFGMIQGNNVYGPAMLTDLSLEVEEFESDSYLAGAVAGLFSQALAFNVSVSGVNGAALRHTFSKAKTIPAFVSSPNDVGAVGGIFGFADGIDAECKLFNCVNALPVEAEVLGEDWDNNHLNPDFLCVGGVAGYASYITATGCDNSGGITVTDELYEARTQQGGNGFFLLAGGIFGIAQGTEVSASVNTGRMDVRVGVTTPVSRCGYALVGGILGASVENWASLADCHNRADVLCYSGVCYEGGVVGYLGYDEAGMLSSDLRNCSNTGDVWGNYIMGGIIGSTRMGDVQNCWNSGDVWGGDFMGGVAGGLEGAAMWNCYNSSTNVVSDDWDALVGALVGMAVDYSNGLDIPMLWPSFVQKCYWHEAFDGDGIGKTDGGSALNDCGTFGDPDPVQGGTVTFIDTSAFGGLMDTLNTWVTNQNISYGGNFLEWDIVDSYDRGAKGYPAFGALAPEPPTPPDEYDWTFAVNPTHGDVIFHRDGWMFTVQTSAYPFATFDLNNDGVVDPLDAALMVYGMTVSDLKYDLNGDGVVDQADMDLLLLAENMTPSTYTPILTPGVTVLACVQTPPSPYPLDFNGTRWSDDHPANTFRFGGFGSGALYTSVLDGHETDATSLALPVQNTATEQYAIANYAFYECSGLAGSLTIPDCVTRIGNWAFAQCGFDDTLTLESVKSVLTNIGEYAFDDSAFIGSLAIPDSVVTIGDCAFSGCTFDGTLTLGDPVTSSLTDTGRSSFESNAFIGSLVIPNSVETIGAWAFNWCTFDGTLTLGDPVASALTHIGEHAFTSCSFEGGLTIPDSVEFIGGSAFHYNAFDGALTLETVKSSLTNIGYSAFSYNLFEGDLTIPDSVVKIGAWAFEGNAFDGALTLGESVETIELYAFAINTFDGSPLTIPDSVISVEWGVFASNVFSHVASWGTLNTASDWMFDGTTFTTNAFVIPEQITTIGEGAFSHATFGGDVIVYDSVTTIGNAAFGYSTFDRIFLPSTGVSFGDAVFAVLSAPTSDIYLRGKFPSDPGGILYDTSLGVTSYVKSEWAPDWDAHNLPGTFFGVDTSVGFIVSSDDALWHERPILCRAWTWDEPFLPPIPPPDEMWVHIDAIAVATAGDVTLEWEVPPIVDTLCTSVFSYALYCSTNLVDWISPTFPGATQGSTPTRASLIFDTLDMDDNFGTIPDRMFFRLKAMK